MLDELWHQVGERLADEMQRPWRLQASETGQVTFVGKGVALVSGLPGVKAQERIVFAGGAEGIAFNLDPDQVGVVLLRAAGLGAGMEARRTGQVVDVPVGTALLGRVVDGLGRPRDGGGAVDAGERWAVEREAPGILDRAPVERPLETGIKAVDALIPVGRGQRELILGDRQTGKTALALDTLINQAEKGLIAIYCAVGQRSSSVARVVETLRQHKAIDRAVVVVASGEDPPGMQFITPYAATSIGEYFMHSGHDVVIVYDDLTAHANAYRELSLLLRRPPGREAYPGDIFYIHSRLLERATQLQPALGGGSMTALPIVETEAENIAAYIPTNLVSITDGQLYLSPGLARKGVLPAIDVGRSVSRVGGKTQLPAFRLVAGELKLAYAQFEELEVFSRFGTRLDEQTRHSIERGRRIREVLKQGEQSPLTTCEQVVVLLALTRGLLDELPLDRIAAAQQLIRNMVAEQGSAFCQSVHAGESLTGDQIDSIVGLARAALAPLSHGEAPVSEASEHG